MVTGMPNSWHESVTMFIDLTSLHISENSNFHMAKPTYKRDIQSVNFPVKRNNNLAPKQQTLVAAKIEISQLIVCSGLCMVVVASFYVMFGSVV